jgi:hypothetical protein
MELRIQDGGCGVEGAELKAAGIGDGALRLYVRFDAAVDEVECENVDGKCS